MQQFRYDDSRQYAHYDEQKNFVCRQAYFIREGTLVPGHACIKENRVVPFDGFFEINDIIHFVKVNKIQPQRVSFDDIWHAIRFENEKETTRQSDRYRDADPSYPGLLAPLSNPDKKKFRMLDGRRRMWKLEDEGNSDGMFYILPVPEIFRYFWMLMPQKKPAG